MTCIVAYRDPDHNVYIGSDSLATDEDLSGLMLNRPKWTVFENYLIASAGSYNNINFLDRMKYDSEFDNVILHYEDVLDLAVSLKEKMDADPIADLEQAFTFIVATKNSIFEIDGSFGVTELNDFCAAGSGKGYATGAYYMCYDADMTPHDLVENCLEAAKFGTPSCGGDLWIWNLKRELK